MKIEEFRHRKLPPFGKCVYCGIPTSETRLTDEHIVPLSLGGTNILQKASCASCAVVTSKLELHLARNIFGHYRVHANVATRHPKKRPTVLPATIIVGKEPAQDLEFAIEDHPYFTLLPVWKTPGMLAGEKPSADFGADELHRFDFVPKHFRELLSLTESDSLNFKVPIKLDEDQFARALAKIAYCEAIGRYGLDGFERTTIIDFIFGKYPFAQHLVGGTTAVVPPPMPKNIDHAIMLYETPIESKNYVVAAVRLFANTGTPTHGMPWYLVVLGVRPEGSHPLDA